MQLKALIAKAALIVGSEYKVAKAIGITPQRLSDWKYERRTCTPEDWALLADIANLDAEDTLVRAVLLKHKGTPKGDLLEQVFAAMRKSRAVWDGDALTDRRKPTSEATREPEAAGHQLEQHAKSAASPSPRLQQLRESRSRRRS